ncbi:unnamed protein product [Cuscuta epithymum]|uniref:C2H2-type domain-containing protein n=1 Tax=Cuscuta epithymum TaxID=186058 RepID=A0AAV0D6S0_9ASTE|nr:unnamed protein product [Cuscuta epithymum]
MPAAVWFALKRSFKCKFSKGDAHDPHPSGKNTSRTKRKVKNRSVCSKPNLQSPTKPVGKSKLVNPIAAPYVGMVNTVWTPVNGGSQHSGPPRRKGLYNGPLRRGLSRSSGFTWAGRDSSSSQPLSCPKCGEKFSEWKDVESHHLSNHAVTQIVEGDLSREIIEMICRTNLQSSMHSGNKEDSNGIQMVLKVHNTLKTLTQFEEYREAVKTKANRLVKKHARCLADGNELLRFHGTTVECHLGMGDSSGLCVSHTCDVCQILRHGFTINSGVGVLTASTSRGALEGVKVKDGGGERKVVMVCRVIGGRVHRALDSVEEIGCEPSLGFDSLAGHKVGGLSSGVVEELIVLSPKALLPCFIVIYKA